MTIHSSAKPHLPPRSVSGGPSVPNGFSLFQADERNSNAARKLFQCAQVWTSYIYENGIDPEPGHHLDLTSPYGNKLQINVLDAAKGEAEIQNLDTRLKETTTLPLWLSAFIELHHMREFGDQHDPSKWPIQQLIQEQLPPTNALFDGNGLLQPENQLKVEQLFSKVSAELAKLAPYINSVPQNPFEPKPNGPFCNIKP